MNYRTTTLLLAFASCFTLSANGNDYTFTEAGLRVGVDAESETSLTSYEVFSTINTPWNWSFSENLALNLSIEMAIGALTGEGDTAGYARFAPTLEVFFGNSPVSVVLSSGPAVYTEDTFNHVNLGSNFQFTSSLGLDWQVNESWAVGYRIQHTSNGGISNTNPGLDMHTASIGYSY